MRRIPLAELDEQWSEARMTRALIHSRLFQRQLVIVPRCYAGGHEADLLAVDPRCMKLVEIEIKISRVDLFADAKKDKWFKWSFRKEPEPLEHLARIWKHYYAMPSEVLHGGRVNALERIPKTSGVLSFYRDHRGAPQVACLRRCRPNRKAQPITAQEALDIARLAGLRMWDAILRLET